MIRLTDKKASGTYTADYLLRNSRGKKVYFFRIGRDYIAVMSDRELPEESFHTVIYAEERKIPLWKQSMDMQMGRMPKASVREERMYHPVRIPADKAQMYRFEVYGCEHC